MILYFIVIILLHAFLIVLPIVPLTFSVAWTIVFFTEAFFGNGKFNKSDIAVTLAAISWYSLFWFSLQVLIEYIILIG